MINNQNLAVLSEKVAYLESAVKNSNEASEISYDNTDSGLTADDVQGAIDEVQEAIDDITSEINKAIVANYTCTGVASTSDTSGWYYADYFFTLGKTYTNGVVVATSQRGVPYIIEADVRNGNELVIRIWSTGSFGTTTEFTVRAIINEAS